MTKFQGWKASISMGLLSYMGLKAILVCKDIHRKDG